MEEKIKILILEDSVTDAELVEHTLRKERIKFISKRVETREDFVKELKDFEPDIILSDYSLPNFDGMEALTIVKKRRPEVPFIMVTGSLGEELTVKLLKEGTTDYILKDKLARLGTAVRRALIEVKERTKRKLVEELLRTSEKKYRELVTNSLVGVYQSNLQGDILFANEALAQILGCGTYEELIGTNAFLFYKKPERRVEFVAELKKTGMVSNFEVELVSRTGVAKHVFINATFDGRVISGMMLDITKRKKTEEFLKKSEERLKKAQSIGKIGNWEFDLITKKIEWSDEVYNIYGRDKKLGPPTEEEEGQYYPPEETRRLREFAKLAVETSRECNYEVTAKLPSGKTVFLSASMIPVKNKDGLVTKLFGTVQDITERKKLEEQLIQSQKMEAIGTLAGGMAHDFNNMLTVIQGYTEMALMDMTKNDPLFNHMENINQAAQRAADLTRQLLIFGRKQHIKLSDLAINQTITDLLKMLKRLIGEDIAITTDLASDGWGIKADKSNMEQVIMNLVVNARDAMPKGGEVTIKTENIVIDEDYCRTNTEAKPGQFIRLSVTDTGMGMDKETMKRLFEPFFSTKEIGKGGGLGLSVVYGIVKQHQGWINVYSEPGHGTIFKIYLPAPLERTTNKDKDISYKLNHNRELSNGLRSSENLLLPAATGQIEKKTEKSITIDTPEGNRERILFVEDEASVREFGRAVLEKHNYVVFAAATAQEAKQLYEQEKGKFHLIFSDTILPDSNGLELVNHFRIHNPKLPVLMCSGYSNEKVQKAIIQQKQLPFIQKPYGIIDMLRVVKETIKSQPR
jgi:PAS domain S-box-containing protein